MGAASMGSRPLSRLNSPSKRACLDTGLAQRWLGAGLRGSGAWQAPGVEPMRGGVANGQGPDAPRVWSISSGGRDARDDLSAGFRIRDPGAEESSLGRSRVWPGAPGE